MLPANRANAVIRFIPKVTQQGGEKHLTLAFSVSHYDAFVTEAAFLSGN